MRRSSERPAPLRAKALGGGSWIALRLGDYERSEQLGEESLALYRSLGDDAGVAVSLNRLGAAVSSRGDVERSVAFQQEAADMYRKLGDDRGLGVTLSNLGYRSVIQGDYEQAKLRCEEALSLFEKVGERGSMPLALINLGLAALLEERYGEALACFRQGLQLSDELGYAVPVVYCLDGLAAVLAATGETEQAATIIGAVEATMQASGIILEPFEQEVHEQTVEALEAALGEEGYAVAQAAGRQLPTDEAVAWALRESRPRETA